MHKVTTITHTVDGIRFAPGFEPGTTCRIFDSQITLAESYAQAMNQRHEAAEILKTEVCAAIDNLESAIERDAAADDLKNLIKELRSVAGEACRPLL